MGNAPSSRIPTPTNATFDEFDEKAKMRNEVNELDASLSRLQVTVPLSSSGKLTLDHVASWETEAAGNPKVQLARTILSHSDIRSALSSRAAKVADQHIFNNVIDFKTGPVTNQKSSGRCWLFATTNVLRYNIMKKFKLKDFQLSQSYLFFWDKLNKSNYYLELMIEHADLPIDDRLINHLSGDLISDGGQWDMVVNLMENYGIVPQTLYPESTHSSLSSPLNALLKTKLREHALILRDLAASLRGAHVMEDTVLATLRAKKEELIREVYTIMTATLGVPPKPTRKLVWEYIDADGKAGRWEGSPLEFYEAFGTKPYSPSECFSLINDPRNEYSKLYTVDKLGNIWGGRPILYVNTDIETMKNTVIKMIKAGQPVFFGCDVGKFSDSAAGIMDTALFEYEVGGSSDGFGAFTMAFWLFVSPRFSRAWPHQAQRLQIGESSMTHAMVISGVHLDSAGRPVRYKVENSWGETSGHEGYFVMTDKWFEEFVYQVVVPKALAPKELVAVFESGERIVLPPWDPMGTLA